MSARGLLTAGALLAAIAVASPAHADLFVPEPGTTTQPTRIRALVTDRQATTRLLQSADLRNGSPRLMWFKAFPSRPQVVVRDGQSLEALERQTVVAPPYNHALRKDPFGPSILSFAMDRWWPAALPEAAGADGPARPLTIVDFAAFTGTVQTSSITGLRALPEPLRFWLERRGFQVSEEVKASLTGVFNKRWHVLAVQLRDGKPNRLGPAQVPLTEFVFASEQPTLPLIRQDDTQRTSTTFDIWTLASFPLVPVHHATVWSTQPWAEQQDGQGQFVATYRSALDAADPTAEVLKRQLTLDLPARPQLVRYTYTPSDLAWSTENFSPQPDAPHVGGQGQRGGLFDVLLCVLLGLTPLLFTPESWFLLWVSRRIPPSPTNAWPNLWAMYNLVVGVYWLATLPGLARAAALLPIIIGLTQLIWPPEPEAADFVRVQFRRKAKTT